MTYSSFKETMSIILNIDSISDVEFEEVCNEHYEAYSQYIENICDDTPIVDWAKEYFEGYSSHTHDIWLDKRGLLLVEINDKLNSNINNIFS